MAQPLSNGRSTPSMHISQRAGLCNAMELAIRFHLWAAQQRSLKHSAVMSTFNVSRATAYRWIAAWRAANGQLVA